ncbi:glycoside hydrolase family 68 protein [Novosphingobium sp.]|uniref:glycoside hydrolase family 68 protein n=1 Tax=Novosphingobium sp. TaxID=1874826 RepID=UPI00286E9B6B|nr:glycoside hydrolase family 68 protein [Novosphingobium sp.]
MNMPEVNLAAQPAAVSAWRPQSYAPAERAPELALVTAADATPILPGIDLWDNWPLAHEDGRTVEHEGRQYWFMLSAPHFADPGLRHDAARIRLLSTGADGWRDHGNVLPDNAGPGSREWAGSAVLHDDGRTVTLFFTAAGRLGEAHSFEQRLFAVRGELGSDGPGNWGIPAEIVKADGRRYVIARETDGKPGLIKAFRDPAWLRDPATGKCHVLITGSAAWSDDEYNGLVGIATLADDGSWTLGDPLIEAVGVNNELERPHVIVRDGLYYLFWSTQSRTFAPGWPAGPNGLYGAVAARLEGPWTPVNGSGLVAANPAQEPTQCYSWWTTGEGEVWSFIDHWGLQGRSLNDHPHLLRGQFGGTPAPTFRLHFAGDQVTIAD